MLDAKDLEAISAIVRGEVQRSEKRMDQKLDAMEKRINQRMDEKMDALEKRMDQKMAKQEKRILAAVDKRIAKSENLILKELDRVQIQMNRRMDSIEMRLDKVEQFYRIERLTNDTLLQLVDKVEALCVRTAALEKAVYA